jgi:predicted lipid-binding transport protein (Tim44 family)
MTVIPIFSGLFGGMIGLLWPSGLGILARFLLAILLACAAAFLSALLVYVTETRRTVTKRERFFRNFSARAPEAKDND